MQNEPRLSEAKRKLLELQLQRADQTSVSSDPAGAEYFPRENPIPLSPAQEQVWRLEQTAGKLTSLHNESITIHRVGPCDPAIVRSSLSEIVRRHEIWRTTYEEVEERPTQIVRAAPDNFHVDVLD